MGRGRLTSAGSVALAFWLALLGTGCGSSAAHPGRPAGAGRPAPCGQPRAPGTTTLGLPGGRSALLEVPAGYDGRHRLPLVVGYPGYTQSPQHLAAQSRLPERGAAAGVLVVLPRGEGPNQAWDFPNTLGVDDVGFTRTLLDELAGTACADPAHTVVTGISDGGDMAADVACALPGRFRAVVSVAASTVPAPGCRPIRIIAVHGDDDRLDPYGGGPDGRPGYPDTPPAATGIDAWAALDGCRTPALRQLAAHVVDSFYPCGADLITVGGGGHTWPGGAAIDSSLGSTSQDYDATATVLDLARS